MWIDLEDLAEARLLNQYLYQSVSPPARKIPRGRTD